MVSLNCAVLETKRKNKHYDILFRNVIYVVINSVLGRTPRIKDLVKDNTLQNYFVTPVETSKSPAVHLYRVSVIS